MNKPALHILFVLENYYPNIGGVETLFKSLAEHLVQAGYQVSIVTRRLRPEDPDFERYNGVEIHRYRFGNRYLFTFLALFPLLKHVRTCNLVHTTSYNAALPAFLAAAFRRKKVLITFHEVWAELWFSLPGMSRVGAWLHYLFEQLILRLPFHRFIGVSQNTSRRLQEAGVSPQKIHTILNGIDYTQFSSNGPVIRKVNADRFNYTFFGRLGVSKGLDLLIPAVTQFHQQYPEVHLNLIIPTSPEKEYQKLMHHLKPVIPEQSISLHHELPFTTLKAILRGSDCVVIPSYSEGFCFAAVETMALNVPIVHSGKGALSEVVGGRQILMSSLSAKALLEALIQAKEGHWQSIPTPAYPLSKTIDQYVAVYEEVSAHTKRKA